MSVTCSSLKLPSVNHGKDKTGFHNREVIRVSVLIRVAEDSCRIVTVLNEVAKVMFLQVCVCPQGRGWYPSMSCRWYPSMPCSRSPGRWYPNMPCRWYPSMPCSRSPGRWYPNMPCRWYPSMPCSRSPGWCLLPGGGVPAPGGVLLLGRGACSQGVRHRPPGQQTTTVADGRHPTGTHSCINKTITSFYVTLAWVPLRFSWRDVAVGW